MKWEPQKELPTLTPAFSCLPLPREHRLLLPIKMQTFSQVKARRYVSHTSSILLIAEGGSVHALLTMCSITELHPAHSQHGFKSVVL